MSRDKLQIPRWRKCTVFWSNTTLTSWTGTPKPSSPRWASFRQNSISKTRMSSVIWTLVFWPKIVNVVIFSPASTWPCSVSQWTTLRPTWLWSETYSAPTSRFDTNNDLKRRNLALDWRNVFIFSGHHFASKLQVHKKYDLKGSTVDREASEKERGKSLPTLKVRNNAEAFTWHKTAFLAI